MRPSIEALRVLVRYFLAREKRLDKKFDEALEISDALIKQEPDRTFVLYQRAVLMLDRETQQTPMARRLRRLRPGPSLRQLAAAPMGRLAGAAMAAALLFAVRTGIWSGMDETRQLVQRLADAHYEAHIAGDDDLLA